MLCPVDWLGYTFFCIKEAHTLTWTVLIELKWMWQGLLFYACKMIPAFKMKGVLILLLSTNIYTYIFFPLDFAWLWRGRKCLYFLISPSGQDWPSCHPSPTNGKTTMTIMRLPFNILSIYCKAVKTNMNRFVNKKNPSPQNFMCFVNNLSKHLHI